MAETEVKNYDPKTDRLRVLEAVYGALGDDTMSFADGAEIREELGLTDDRAANAMKFLEDDGLLKAIWTFGDRTPTSVRITHRGVRAMEDAKDKPAQSAKTGLPPYSVVVNNFHGDVNASQIQAGSPGATQRYRAGDITIGAGTKQAIADFVARFEADMQRLVDLGEQTQADVDRMMPAVAVMKLEATSREPKKNFLVECRNSVKSVLEHGVGGVVTAGLLTFIALIHL